MVKCCFSQRKMLKNKLSVNVKLKGQLENTDGLIHKCIMFSRNCYDMVSFGFGVSCLLEHFSPSAISSSSNIFIPQGFFSSPRFVPSSLKGQIYIPRQKMVEHSRNILKSLFMRGGKAYGFV